jgi:hypothetical protein
MQYNGRELNLAFTLGTLKDVKKATGVNVLAGGGEGFNDPEILSEFIFAAAKRGGTNLTMEEIENMPLTMLNELASSMTELVESKGESGPLSKPPK